MNEQALFNYFSKAHGITLLQDDFDIIADNTRPEWISVEKYLPDSYVDVLLVVGGSDVVSGYYLSHKKSFFDNHDCETVKNVTHWMPQPEPPKQ